jgi:hypothetical protein
MHTQDARKEQALRRVSLRIRMTKTKKMMLADPFEFPAGLQVFP